MSGYRFCRTDDIPLLVSAHNRCWGAEFPGDPPLSVEQFKHEARTLGLWASSCMLAVVDDEPIGVLLGAKRDDANLVHRIAILPEHRRRGHGRHLIESLTRKAAILGPPRLEAEVPEEWTAARRFLEASGFELRRSYADFVLDAPPGETAAGLAGPVTLAELIESGTFDPARTRSWRRRLPQLRAMGSALGGLAIASDARIEAFLLHQAVGEPSAAGIEIVALGEADPAHRGALVRILLAELRQGGPLPLSISRLSEDEVSFDCIEPLGFRRTRRTSGYVVEARA